MAKKQKKIDIKKIQAFLKTAFSTAIMLLFFVGVGLAVIGLLGAIVSFALFLLKTFFWVGLLFSGVLISVTIYLVSLFFEE